MEDKTNVMRILDQKKIEYKERTYLNTGAIGGQEVAGVVARQAGQHLAAQLRHRLAGAGRLAADGDRARRLLDHRAVHGVDQRRLLQSRAGIEPHLGGGLGVGEPHETVSRDPKHPWLQIFQQFR